MGQRIIFIALTCAVGSVFNKCVSHLYIPAAHNEDTSSHWVYTVNWWWEVFEMLCLLTSTWKLVMPTSLVEDLDTPNPTPTSSTKY